MSDAVRSVSTTLERRYRDVLARWRPGARIETLRPLPGGHSGHTWLASLSGADVDRVVVKSGAPGRPVRGRHDVGRQGAVLAALAGAPNVAVPGVFGVFEGDPQVMLNSYLVGDGREPVMDGVAGLTPDTLAVRAHSAAEMLASLHAAPISGRPANEPPSEVADELARWTATMRSCDPEVVAGGERLVELLAGSIPTPTEPVIVHGDYRLGNLLCDDGLISGIIDWEIWSVTDPRIDLGWFLLFCDPSDWPGIAGDVPGMPAADELLATYERSAGPVPDVEWFIAFNRMKMAAISAHNLRRHREGRLHDPSQERLPTMIGHMIALGTEELGG